MKYIYKSFLLTLFVFLIVQINTLRSQNSVLANGDWYKLGIVENGIYQLSYQDFIDMGFDAANIDPDKIQIYGNIEGVLPEANNIVVPYGLVQNAIFVSGADDGSFDQDDYVAFYAQGPHEWYFERRSEQFRYLEHPYAEKNFYFVTIGEEDGSRIEAKASTNETPLKTITSFKDHHSHEANLFNFVKSGRKWFGESFEDGDLVFDFDFPNFNNESPVKFGIYAAGNSKSSNEILVSPQGAEQQELNIPAVIGTYTYAKEGVLRSQFLTTADFVKLTLSFVPPSPTDNAWIDYIEVTAVRDLIMHNHQMDFSYDVLLNQNQIFRFKLSNAHDNLKIWEVSDPYHTKEISGSQLIDDTLQFGLQLQQTHYFIAFDEEGFLIPEFIESVENQDLKGLEPFDYLIVTVDEFLEEAERVATFHEEFDGFRCEIVLINKIYNEFSSGKQDPTAIRNFLRYHYNKNTIVSNKPKYLLLFGDASYDYKDVLPNNTNLVPVYQSEGSTSTTNTYNTDDYYGIMGQSGGDSSLGEINISVGRFPVKTVEEAKIMVDKTIHYASNLEETMGDWRNKVCFIADDEDGNLHFDDSNSLADTFTMTHPEFNVDKIFLDSYVQVSTASGYRYPDVTEAINRNVEEGTMFFNYTGHGGHLALTDERVLQISDILSWENYDKLGVWIVASCEFGPFDNPAHTSAGEHVVLNPKGGGVAIFTTTRLAYANYNFRLNEKFHEIAFSRKEDGSHYRMGDIIRYAKNESGNLIKNLNFVLLGDPALKMAYPEYHVETTHLNGNEVNPQQKDTIKARQTVSIRAEVTNINHQLLTDFNGLVYYKVYGKPSTYATLANDADSDKAEFNIVDLIIHEGVARVNAG